MVKILDASDLEATRKWATWVVDSAPKTVRIVHVRGCGLRSPRDKILDWMEDGAALSPQAQR